MNTKQLLSVHVIFSDNTARNPNTRRYFYSKMLGAYGVVEKEDNDDDDMKYLPYGDQYAITKYLPHIPETQKYIRVPKYNKYNEDESESYEDCESLS